MSGFDISDSDTPGVNPIDEDEITQKYDLPHDMPMVGATRVVDAFEQFWPDHMHHELLGQTMSAGEVILTCTDCDLKLHVPSLTFVNWLMTK